MRPDVSTRAGEVPLETIGQRLRRLRTDRAMSQRELAGPGVSYAYISRIEAGSRQPSVKALRTLARKLGVSAEYLETGNEIGDRERRELRLADAELELRLDDRTEHAEQTLVEVLDECVLAGDTQLAARAVTALGLAASREGRYDDAIARLEEAVRSGIVTPANRPDVFATLGRAYAHSGNAQSAVHLFEDCLERLSDEAPQDASARVRFATYLSFALADLGDLARAREVAMSALDGVDDLADPYTQVRLFWSLARLFVMQDQSAAALDYARRAVALLEATEDSLHLARAHVLCAVIMNDSAEHERAGSHLELAERLLGARPEPSDLGTLREEQARQAAGLGDGEAAIRFAQEALRIVGDSDPAVQGTALSALAHGLVLRGDVEGAIVAYTRSVDLLADHAQWRDASHAGSSLGRLLRDAGREGEAAAAFERSAELATHIAGERSARS